MQYTFKTSSSRFGETNPRQIPSFRQLENRPPRTAVESSFGESYRYQGRTIRYDHLYRQWYFEATGTRRTEYLQDEHFAPENRPSNSRPPARTGSAEFWRLRPEPIDTESSETDNTTTVENSPFLSPDEEEEDMTANAREIKICTPSPFNGEPEKLNKFLQEIGLYTRINSAIFNSDENKIIFTLSFMKGGTTAGWSESFIQTADTLGTFGNWADFERALKTAFSPIDSEGTARTKLRHLKQGSGGLDNYIAEFRILVSKCGITDNTSLIEYFMEGLNPKLLERVYFTETMPTTIQGWYEAANKFDGQSRRAKAIADRARGGFTAEKPPPPRVTHIRDPNAMDIDAIRMSQNERREHMHNGKCFICQQKGHRSTDHKDGKVMIPPRNDQGRFIPRRTGADAYKRIRSMMNDLPAEEKEKALKMMEDGGF